MEEIIDILNDVEEEELEIRPPIRRAPRKIRERINQFDKWDDFEFFDRFRLSKGTANLVLDLIRDRIKTKTTKNRAISPEVKLFTALKFYASGNFLMSVGDEVGIQYSTASKIVKEVSEALASLRPQFISLPTSTEDLNNMKKEFYQIAKFPNCVGALDCSHVKIQSVGGDLAEVYRNRKGIFSVNVQAVCDAQLQFRNIVTRWPGSSHDSHIFNSSRLKKDFVRNVFGNSVLVGDSGYGCTNFLITPLESVQLPEERLFQEAQVRTRNPIERCFGIWKRRFPILALGIRLKEDRHESVIVATAVLHNICQFQGEDTPPLSEEAAAAIEAINQIHQIALARRDPRDNQNLNLVTRNNLIYEYFRSMV